MAESIDPTNPDSSGRIERRAFPRRRAWENATFVPADKPLSPAVRIKPLNISQSGIGFFVEKELAVDQRILIELPTSTSSAHPARLQAEVRWVVPDKQPGKFRVGCCWVERLTYADILRFS